MVNESDMNEKSARAYTRDGKVYAKDGGLMAIRCMLDDKERCTNGNVRGVALERSDGSRRPTSSSARASSRTGAKAAAS